MFHPEQLQMRISLVAIFPEQLLRKAIFLLLKNLIFHNRKYALAFYDAWTRCSWSDCVSLGVSFEVLLSIRKVVLSILNATPIHSAETKHCFEQNRLHIFRNNGLSNCTDSFALHRRQWSFITLCPTDVYFCRCSSGRFDLDWVQSDLCDCSSDCKKCSPFTEVPALHNFAF